MIQITPKTAPGLIKNLMHDTVKEANIYSKEAGKNFTIMRGYIFASKDPQITQATKENAANKINSLANLPEECGKTFLQLI